MPYPNFTDPRELELYLKALQGDEEATKIYCGSYMLIRKINDYHLYRHKGDTAPEGYVEVKQHFRESVYDKDGFLISRFWSLPRL